MHTVAAIQARMGSSRLPGKVMLPLDGKHVLERVIERIEQAKTVDDIVVATSKRKRDDIVARYAERAGAYVHRGDEEDVLGRMFDAAAERDADIVVRMTADNPLSSPRIVDAIVERLVSEEADYVSNSIERTFPLGLIAEAFTMDTFRGVERNASEPHHREHVTMYYKENPEKYRLKQVLATDVFDSALASAFGDLRLTLDEADDYELLRATYERANDKRFLTVEDAVQIIRQNHLQELNQHVSQKSPSEDVSSAE